MNIKLLQMRAEILRREVEARTNDWRIDFQEDWEILENSLKSEVSAETLSQIEGFVKAAALGSPGKEYEQLSQTLKTEKECATNS